MLVIQNLTPSDIDDVLAVQALAYSHFDLHESADFFLNRIAVAPQSCWLARSNADVLGYLISYPWHDGLPPTLDVALASVPVPATHWFLHDCAITPGAMGQGIGRALVEQGVAHAQSTGFDYASLVSLHSAAPYWAGMGYETVDDLPGLAEKLAGYGPGAQYMRRRLRVRG